MKLWFGAVICIAAILAACLPARAGEITVGPHKMCPTIERAMAQAHAGDTIVIFPREDGEPYERVAINVDKAHLTIRGIHDKAGRRLCLSGQGVDYTGQGRMPRAIVQFGPDAEGGRLEGFELVEAHNAEGNGAGVRIDRASNVTIGDCEIHGCDMGIMSGGDGTTFAAANQRIESCLIYANGASARKGQSHNLYLGGTSAMITNSEVASSLDGHNIKSRCHLMLVRYCYIHDSANRELDLVDGERQTTRRLSDAVLLGNIIIKDPNGAGNHAVIHFGADGEFEHNGTLWLIHNTIVTPFAAAVAELSATQTRVRLINNIIWDGNTTEHGQQLVQLAAGRPFSEVIISGSHNWLSKNFGNGPAAANLEASYIAPAGESPPFWDVARGDYHLKANDLHIVAAGLPWSQIVPLLPTTAAEARLPADLGQYKWPLATQARPKFHLEVAGDLGAYGFDVFMRPPKGEAGSESRPATHRW